MQKKSEEYYKQLVFSKNVFKKDLLKAFDITRKFIIEKNMILSGGMAIDYALRLKGTSLYEDECQMPDYDIYSSRFVEDAYELATILCRENMPNVSCINAMHVSTMRVRVNYNDVADITYCPKEIFDKIPTLIYKNIKIVHPHWKMIDQHLSLSEPFTKTGRDENVVARWEKDASRYMLLENAYKFDDAERDDRMYSVVEINLKDFNGLCLYGLCAADFAYDKNSEKIKVNVLKNMPISFCSTQFDEHLKQLTETEMDSVKYYSQEFGVLKRKIMYNSSKYKLVVEVFDTHGTLMGASKLSDKHNFWVCNPQGSMVYILYMHIKESSKHIKEQYLYIYNLYKKKVAKGDHPTLSVYGTHNYTESHLYHLTREHKLITERKTLQDRPSNSYPVHPECNTKNVYDVSDNLLYERIGREIKPFNLDDALILSK